MQNVMILAMIWGTSFYLSKMVINETSVGAAVFQRIFWALITVTIILGIKNLSNRRFFSYKKKDIVKGLFLGSLSIGTPLTILFFALPKVPTSVASLINGLVPSFVLILVFFRGLPIKYPYAIGSGLLSAIGITVLCFDVENFSSFRPDRSFFEGLALLIAMDICYSIANVYYDKLKPEIDPTSSLLFQLIGSILVVGLFFYHDILNTPLIHQQTLSAVTLGILNTAVAFLLYWKIVERDGSLIAAQAPNLAPIFAIIISLALGETSIRLSYLIGSAFVITGVKLAQLSRI